MVGYVINWNAINTDGVIIFTQTSGKKSQSNKDWRERQRERVQRGIDIFKEINTRKHNKKKINQCIVVLLLL